MAETAIFLFAVLIASLLLDATVRPRRARIRRMTGLVVHLLAMLGAFGLFLAGAGNPVVAAVLSLAVMALLTVASNAKYTMLGEPLVFSDLALLIAVVRHPRFYFTAISVWQRWLLAVAGVVAGVVLVSQVSPRLPVHLAGLALLGVAVTLLLLVLRGRWRICVMMSPDHEGDLIRYGLIATLIVYWQRWRESADPPAAEPLPYAPAPDAPDAPDACMGDTDMETPWTGT